MVAWTGLAAAATGGFVRFVTTTSGFRFFGRSGVLRRSAGAGSGGCGALRHGIHYHGRHLQANTTKNSQWIGTNDDDDDDSISLCQSASMLIPFLVSLSLKKKKM